MHSSKILNKQSNFLGLSTSDFLFLSGFYMLSQALLFPLGFEFFGLILVILLLFFLIPIRLKYRKKIIRNTLFYLFIKIFKRGFVNVYKKV